MGSGPGKFGAVSSLGNGAVVVVVIVYLYVCVFMCIRRAYISMVFHIRSGRGGGGARKGNNRFYT